jgi:hypothetical protein
MDKNFVFPNILSARFSASLARAKSLYDGTEDILYVHMICIRLVK